MPDPKDILVENLRDTVRQIQRYMVVGIGSAFLSIAIARRGPELWASGQNFYLPILCVEVDPGLAGITLIVAHVIFGSMAVSATSRVGRIAKEIGDKKLVNAALMYPSIATAQFSVLRIGSAMLPPLLILAGYLVEQVRGETTFEVAAFVGFLVISVPYFILAYRLRTPSFGL